MKKILLIIVAIFPLLSAAQQKTVGNIKVSGHPRLLLLRGEEDKLKQQIAADGNWQTLNQRLLNECDRILPLAPVKRELIGKRLLDKSREALRRVFFLSYGWRVSGKKVYADRAKQELLNISAFTDWHPEHFLDVAEMTLAAAIGYDWLYDQLSPEEKTTIKNAILQKGIEPSEDPRFSREFIAVDNNWNQVCNTGVALGAMAIAEDYPDVAQKMVSRAVQSIHLPMEVYKPDGAYPEGYNYWDYGTTYNTILISALQKAYGTDYGLSQLPGFMKTGSYMLHMTAPSGNCFNYSDSGLGNSLHTAMFWFAGKLNDASILWFEKQRMAKMNDRGREGNRLLPTALIWGAGFPLDHIPPPAASMWWGSGLNPVALMRSDWSDQGIFLGIKGGSAWVNHAHMDAGSFVIEAGGQRWAADLGMQSYESLESKGVDLWNRKQESQRWMVFRLNNKSHNTLIADSALQNVSGKAEIVGHSTQPTFMSAVLNTTSIYTGLPSVKRGAAIVDHRYVVVQDELTTGNKAVELRWNMITAATVTVLNNKQLALMQNGKRMILQLDWPDNVTFDIKPAAPEQPYDEANPGYTRIGISAKIDPNKKVALYNYFIPDGVKVRPVKKALSAWPAGK